MTGAVSVWIFGLSFLLLVAAIAALMWKSIAPGEGDDPTGMVGQQGIAQETFTQDGVVFARGELWKATSDGGIIQKGDTVQIRGVRSGLVLVVSRWREAEKKGD